MLSGLHSTLPEGHPRSIHSSGKECQDAFVPAGNAAVEELPATKEAASPVPTHRCEGIGLEVTDVLFTGAKLLNVLEPLGCVQWMYFHYPLVVDLIAACEDGNSGTFEFHRIVTTFRKDPLVLVVGRNPDRELGLFTDRIEEG